MPKRINCKSDFDFILRLKDCTDPKKTIPFPECDFDARFWTSNKANAYTASHKDGVYTNCFRAEDGGMHFVFDNHRLGVGTLKWELHTALPNAIYPDGTQDLYEPQALDIELVQDAGDCPTTAVIEAMVPYIKGEAFTYEDFTAGQIAELQRPAVEAAERADVAEGKRAEAEKLRVTAENKRVEAETARAAAEAERCSAESVRVTDETARRAAETRREVAEAARVEAEAERAAEFAGFAATINGKQDALTTSEDLALSGENVLSLTERAKQRLFDDMWRTAAGPYGTVDHTHFNDDGTPSPYYLNELWLTYEEAINVYNVTSSMPTDCGWAHTHIRTNLWYQTGLIYGSGWDEGPFLKSLFRDSDIEVARISEKDNGIYYASYVGFFDGCTKLKEVIGILGDVSHTRPIRFKKCALLEKVLITRLQGDVDLRWSPLVSLDSIQYMIAEAVNTTAITITVHPDVYAKLTDEGNAEWHKVLLDAAEKNITFATT